MNRGKKVRPLHMVKFWWRTRHWDRRHGPGCPVRYGSGPECLGMDFWCVP